ncbi:MAG: carboxylesterase family protein [Sphaerochaetaceae bacterium]|nr:carboxylesterase family protein [Sphaerochaetaceae bacterium]
MKAGFWILYAILSALFCAVLELNKNTLLGWALFALLLVAFPVLFRLVALKSNGFVKFLFWACYLALFAGILILTWPPVKAVPASDASKPASTGIIQTDKGKVRGVLNSDGDVEIYAGIPYAKPPVGELRWRAPQDPEPWEGILECDRFAPMSMQVTNLPIYDSLVRIIGYHDYKISLNDNYVPPVSEDSLYLNIWKPAGECRDLPVLVYIHGGSLQTGQTWTDDYNGTSFARNGVICVNMGYRLGVFGFFADDELLKQDGTTGNYGLLDQIKALQWVRDNITAFGGDPDNVTIVGESAGAVCVDALCVSPLAKGLFRRAILESSTLASVNPPHSYRPFDQAIRSGKRLLEKYKCSSVDDLRKLSSKALVGEMSSQHHVTVDGYVLPDSPYNLRKQGIHNEEAMIHGFNDLESGPFIIFDRTSLKNYESKVRSYFRDVADDVLDLYDAKTDEEAAEYWAEIYGAVFFNYSHYCLNRLAAADGIPVYEYLFTKKNKSLSSWHSGELRYAFHNIPEKTRLYDDADRHVSDVMHSYWVNFAKTGDPNGAGLPVFEQNRGSDMVLELGDVIGMRHEPYLAFYEIMDEMQDFEPEIL